MFICTCFRVYNHKWLDLFMYNFMFKYNFMFYMVECSMEWIPVSILEDLTQIDWNASQRPLCMIYSKTINRVLTLNNYRYSHNQVPRDRDGQIWTSSLLIIAYCCLNYAYYMLLEGDTVSVSVGLKAIIRSSGQPCRFHGMRIYNTSDQGL